jgi:hypothetical protein
MNLKKQIRKVLKETHNEKIIGILKKKFNFTDYHEILYYLTELGFEENEVSKIFGEWFKLETGIDWVDYHNYKNIIIVGSKTNFLKHMLNKYDHIKGNNEVYFFDNGHHFATLYVMGRFMEMRHDGSLDEYGRRK